MDEIKMEREIKEMLHQCADELHAPDSMQARVKFALNNAPARKYGQWEVCIADGSPRGPHPQFDTSTLLHYLLLLRILCQSKRLSSDLFRRDKESAETLWLFLCPKTERRHP